MTHTAFSRSKCRARSRTSRRRAFVLCLPWREEEEEGPFNHSLCEAREHACSMRVLGSLPPRLAASIRSGLAPGFDDRAPVRKVEWNCRPDTAVCPRSSGGGVPNVMMRGIRNAMITSFATRNVARVAPLKQAPHQLNGAVEKRWVVGFRRWVGIICGFKFRSHLAGASRGGRVCSTERTSEFGLQFCSPLSASGAS